MGDISDLFLATNHDTTHYYSLGGVVYSAPFAGKKTTKFELDTKTQTQDAPLSRPPPEPPPYSATKPQHSTVGETILPPQSPFLKHTKNQASSSSSYTPTSTSLRK